MSRDLRKYARSSNFQLAVGAFALLFVVGLGLIYLIYGKGAALMGLACMLVGLTPVALILIILFFVDRILKRAGRE